MKLVMNTENARALAVAYGQQSDEALRMAQQLTGLLTQAAMDDTYDVSGSLNGMSEELDIGDVVLRHQADIMDGLTVDVDALAQEMGVNRWRVDKQLKRVEGGQIDAGQALISLVDFGNANITGLDTTVRDFVPDAAPIGQDPEFDALIQRLDGWLLSAIVDGRSVAGVLTDAGRVEDLGLLADRLGMPDLATVTTTRQFIKETRTNGRGDDPRRETVIETIPLPTSEYDSYTSTFVTDALVAQRKLSRVAVLPSLGELFDLSTYQYSYQHKRGGGDEDYETRWRTRNRTAEQIAEAVADLNSEWKDLAWLPAVLAGQAVPPPELATDVVLRNRVIDFAKAFGYHDANPNFRPNGGPRDESLRLIDDSVDLGPAGYSAAIDFLVDARVLADALENPRPIQKARLPFAGQALEASIEFGRAQGVITDDTEANARTIALHLSGLDITTDLTEIDPAELELEAPELATEELVGLLATAIPPHQLTENRLIQAITFVQRADTVAERIERIEQTVLGLKTVTTVGEPAMTRNDWLQSLPAKVRQERFDTDIDDLEFNWLLDHAGVPGYHKSGDWKKGKGKRYFHLVNEADGKVDDFIVEVIPKKKGWFGQALMTVAKVAISIYFPPMGVAIAAMDAAIAASQGNWLGAGMAALGAVAAGTAVWASSAASTASQATSNVVKAADALADGAGSLQALNNANQAFTAANSAANLANTAANAAAFANAGVRAGVAFSQDDILGGVVNSVTALGAGASTFGYGNVGQNLATTADVVDAAGTTVEAIENEDFAGALAGGLGTASSLVDLGAGVGDFSDENLETLDQVASTLDDAADLTGAGGAIAKGIEEERWASLVGSGLRFGSSAVQLAGNEDGIVSGLVYDRSDEDAFDADIARMDRYRSWVDGAADLADGGLALAEGDALGGAALLSSGTSGVTRLLSGGDGLVAPNLERLDSITNIADKIATAGPGIDHATAMGLIGPEMNALVGSFATSGPAFVGSGNIEQDLVAVRAERQAAQAGLDTLDDLLALDTTEGSVAALLGTTRTELAGDLVELERAEDEVAEAYREEMAAIREAALPAPNHVPVLKPPVPSHLPVARPNDLIPPGARVMVTTPQGQVLMTPGPDGLLVPVETTTRGAGGQPGPLTPDQQRKLVDLARLEQVAAVEDHAQSLRGRLDVATGREQLQLRRDIDQLEKRRDGLLRTMRNPESQDRDHAQYDGRRFVVDDNMDATLYYWFGSEHDRSGETGPRTPVVLGPGTLDRIVDDEVFRQELQQIVDGTSPVPGAGRFQIDRTWSTKDFHLGRTWVDYWTKRNPDGTLTSTFLLTNDDGVKDVTIPPGSPHWLDELMGADGVGPDNEFFGRPYFYEPAVIDRITYPDHGQGLAAAGDIVFDGSVLDGSADQTRGLTSNGDPFLPSPRRPDDLGRVSLDDFPALHSARIYQNGLRPNSDLLLAPSSGGDWSLGSDLVWPTVAAGPYKMVGGVLAGGTAGQKMGPDGRPAVGFDAKLGWRAGVDGPVPWLPRVQGGYLYDDLGGVDLRSSGLPIDLPGVMSAQAVGPAPGVAPTELYDLANPLAWPEGASVRLGQGTGHEHHFKAGTTGDTRFSAFIDRGGQVVELDEIASTGGSIELSHSLVEAEKTALGAAVNFGTPVPILSEFRAAPGYTVDTGRSTSTSTAYGPDDVDAYLLDLMTGRAADGRDLSHTTSMWETSQLGIDLSLGRPSPRFETGVRGSKALPLSYHKVASTQRPDRTWESTYQGGGLLWDDVAATTTVDGGGAVTGVEIKSAVSPIFGGEPIDFTIDTDAYVSVLESIQHDRDPLLALEGRPGIPDELFADPLTEARFRHRIVDDIQGAGDYAVHHPLPGNLALRETPRGESVLGPIDPAGLDLRQVLVDAGHLDRANPPLANRVITPGELATGAADRVSEIAGELQASATYAGGAAAYGGEATLGWLGLEAYTPEVITDSSLRFQQESLDQTIAAGQELYRYGQSVWADPTRLPGDIIDAGTVVVDGVVQKVDDTVTAVQDGDGHTIGATAVDVATLGLGGGVGLGLATRAGRAGRLLARPDDGGGAGGGGPGGTGGGGAGGGGAGGGGDGGAANRASFERYRAELESLDESFPGGATNRLTFEKYRAELREKAGRPPVEDAELGRIVDELYRPGAQVGSGSSAAAARRERSTGRPTVAGSGSETWHHTKVRERTTNLERWLEANPTARPGDRQAAEDLIADHKSYLEHRGDDDADRR